MIRVDRTRRAADRNRRDRGRLRSSASSAATTAASGEEKANRNGKDRWEVQHYSRNAFGGRLAIGHEAISKRFNRWICLRLQAYSNVTHRMCTHWRRNAKIKFNAARHSYSVWPCNPSHPRGAGNQSGRGCGALRAAQNILQRRRARRAECLFGQYRKSRQGSENATSGPLPAALNLFCGTIAKQGRRKWIPGHGKNPKLPSDLGRFVGRPA